MTSEQIRSYHADGFLILPDLFNAQEVRAMQQAAEELSTLVGPIVRENPRLQVDPVGDGLRIRQVWPLIDISPQFNALANDPRLIDVMTSLFGEKPVLFEDKLNYKYPRGGTAFAMHQDYAYWRQYSPRLSTVLIYLDDTNEQNGCLEVVAGMHTQGLIPHHHIQGPKSDLTFDGVDPSRKTVQVKGPAGTAVVFSCFTPHASGPNLSQNPRRAIILTYNPASDGSSYAANIGSVLTDTAAWLRRQELSSNAASSNA